MLSQLLQVCRLIQTQFQDKHVCTQHTQGNGSLTTVKWVFSSISRGSKLQNSLYTVKSLVLKLSTGLLTPFSGSSIPASLQSGTALHSETTGTTLNTDQSQDGTTCCESALTHLRSSGYLQGILCAKGIDCLTTIIQIKYKRA